MLVQLSSRISKFLPENFKFQIFSPKTFTFSPRKQLQSYNDQSTRAKTNDNTNNKTHTTNNKHHFNQQQQQKHQQQHQRTKITTKQQQQEKQRINNNATQQ